MDGRRGRTTKESGVSSHYIVSENFDPADRIWEKLKYRAEELNYGTLACELQVHGGQIRQVDITIVKEKFRAD